MPPRLAGPRSLGADYRDDYSLVASARHLVFNAATAPRPVTELDGGGTSIGLPPGEWLAWDLLHADSVQHLGVHSGGSGVALRDGSFAMVSQGVDGPGRDEIWSWDPAAGQIREMLTSTFTNGGVGQIVTDGVDIFVGDGGTNDAPTFRIWKIDLATATATSVHEEDYRAPTELFFFGADHGAFYTLTQTSSAPGYLPDLTVAADHVPARQALRRAARRSRVVADATRYQRRDRGRCLLCVFQQRQRDEPRASRAPGALSRAPARSDASASRLTVALQGFTTVFWQLSMTKSVWLFPSMWFTVTPFTL